MTDFPGYLTIAAAAKRLGVHRTTIWRAIERGDLSAFRSARNGRVRLLDAAEIEAIERVTKERDRKRTDWSGEDWVDFMVRAAPNRHSDRWVEVFTSDIWPENPMEWPERTEQPAPVSWDDDEDEDEDLATFSPTR